MATYEQCKSRLTELLRTRQDVLDICIRLDYPDWTNTEWTTQEQFVAGNIEGILNRACKRQDLDRLGLTIGIPTDAEQERTSRQSEVVFVAGQMFDAHIVVCTIFRLAKRSLVIMDPYVDESLLAMLSSKEAGVGVQILTHRLDVPTKTAAQKFGKQYGGLEIRLAKGFHDRFVIVDEREYYHSGHSLKDIGKAVSMIRRVAGQEEIETIRSEFDRLWATASRL